MTAAAPLLRHNAGIAGQGIPLVFGHGYGCDQSVWRKVQPAFADRFRTVLFDHAGAGAVPSPFDPRRHASLDGYARDVIELCEALGSEPVIFVGHSVSCMIGALAAAAAPERFRALVMIGPSPCYLEDGDYHGGFTAEDVESLLDLLEADHTGWAAAMAPTIMGNADRPELAEDLRETFCRMAPEAAQSFARVTFTSDNRRDLARVATPTLVLQCAEDAIAPPEVGKYVHHALLDSRLVQLRATGHCPHLSAPEEVVAVMDGFLREMSRAA